MLNIIIVYWMIVCIFEYLFQKKIKELKEIIAKQTTIKEKYDPELIKLLHKGKVMDDEDAVDKYSIDAEGYVVLVKQLPGKPKPPVCRI